MPARAQGPDPGEDAAPAKGGGAKAGLARAPSRKGKGEKKTRVVHMNDGQATGDFVGNGIRTAKYNVLTFAPIFLWEMFSRAAYFYFLIQARALPRAGGVVTAAPYPNRAPLIPFLREKREILTRGVRLLPHPGAA